MEKVLSKIETIKTGYWLTAIKMYALDIKTLAEDDA